MVRKLKAPDDIISMRGDFNCTIDPEYSHHSNASKKYAGDLRSLVNEWRLIDALTPTMSAAPQSKRNGILRQDSIHIRTVNQMEQ